MQIEKNIPLPTSSSIGAPRKYPFFDMAVGESVFFEGKKIPCKEYIAAKAAGSKIGADFVGRTVDGGVRIWRVS